MSSSHKDSSKNQYSNFDVAGPALVGLSIELRIVLWEFQGRGQPPEFRSSREGAGWLRLKNMFTAMITISMGSKDATMPCPTHALPATKIHGTAKRTLIRREAPKTMT